MTTTPPSSAIQCNLEWSIKKFGADFFTTRWLWTRSENIFRWEEKSTLEELKSYENFFGGLTNYGLVAAMRNIAKIIKGTDKERVKMYAYKLRCQIRPKMRRVSLPVRSVAMVVTDQTVPTIAEHQEVDIPYFYIDCVDFDKATCEGMMVKELHILGLPMPSSIEYNLPLDFLQSHE